MGVDIHQLQLSAVGEGFVLNLTLIALHDGMLNARARKGATHNDKPLVAGKLQHAHFTFSPRSIAWGWLLSGQLCAAVVSIMATSAASVIPIRFIVNIRYCFDASFIYLK